jgi:hypothetical protein
MNEGICDFRFAMCDCASVFTACRRFSNSKLEPKPLSVTPRFSGVCLPLRARNRFSGFDSLMQTAEAVLIVIQRIITPFEAGVLMRLSTRRLLSSNHKSQI